MFVPRKPSPEQISRFIISQVELPFSYPEVSATGKELPSGYIIDHNRVKLGHGERVFARAIEAIKKWKQFDLGWVNIVPLSTPLEIGAVVAVLARHFGFWSLNACRVVYLIDKDEPVKTFGFAYGTLPSHVERGEERFTIEWHPDDNSIWYEILAFSRPNNLLVQLAVPLARILQKRFARDSKRRMLEYVSEADER